MIRKIDRQDDFALLARLASDKIIRSGGKRIFIGLINANTVLKEWYAKQGFVTYEVKTFEHLPFDVCMMEKIVNNT